MVGYASGLRFAPPLSNPPYEIAAPFSASGRFERLWRIDVEEGTFAIHEHFGDRLGVLGDQVPCADVAVERHQFRKEAARP